MDTILMKESMKNTARPAAAVAAGWIGLWYLLGFTMEFAVYAVALLYIIVLTITDLREKIIPNEFVIAMGVTGLVLLPFNPFVNLLSAVLGMLIVGGILALASRVTKGQVGMGDAKLFLVLGLFFGLKGSFMILMYSLVISGIVGLALITLKRATRKTVLPFVPFVLCGLIIELFLKF